MTLSLIPLQRFPLIHPGDKLPEIIAGALENNGLALQDGDILVLAQKIVSKSEGQLVNLTSVEPSEEARHYAEITDKNPRLIELILSESQEVLRAQKGIIISEHRLGFISANAGIDHSNVDGPWGDPDDWVLLLPQNPDASAQVIRQTLEDRFGVKIGVLVIDSHGRAWRNGTVGVTIGLSGMPALVDLRGESDLFNYRLRVTQVAAADELAAGASLMMGQAHEGTPVVLARGFPYPLRDSQLRELIRPKERDLFR
ncbi:MAG: coenzyme F420-0:L-glutamate ligase [Brevefilum sp.]|nr:coenzyme F420-0:L-glutamate ligase [Brevefilum sp.]